MILNDKKRLELLNVGQPDRPWRSSEEKRLCIACDRTFKGTSVTIRGTNGLTRLSCPGCGSGPEYWVRPGNPLTDADIWADWERAIERAAAEVPEEDEQLSALS